MKDEQKEILRLAAEIACTDLQELREEYRRRITIQDGVIQAFRDLEVEYRNKLSDMQEAIDNLKALYRINMNVLGIINAPAEVGEKDATDFSTRFTQ